MSVLLYCFKKNFRLYFQISKNFVYVFLYHCFNICRIYDDVSFFISILNICVFFLLSFINNIKDLSNLLVSYKIKFWLFKISLINLFSILLLSILILIIFFFPLFSLMFSSYLIKMNSWFLAFFYNKFIQNDEFISKQGFICIPQILICHIFLSAFSSKCFLMSVVMLLLTHGLFMIELLNFQTLRNVLVDIFVINF